MYTYDEGFTYSYAVYDADGDQFKVYPLYLNSYYYRIDSVEHTVYWDGEIEEIAGRKFKR